MSFSSSSFLTLERDELVNLGRGRDLRAIRAPPFGSEGANCGKGWGFGRGGERGKGSERALVVAGIEGKKSHAPPPFFRPFAFAASAVFPCKTSTNGASRSQCMALPIEMREQSSKRQRARPTESRRGRRRYAGGRHQNSLFDRALPPTLSAPSLTVAQRDRRVAEVDGVHRALVADPRAGDERDQGAHGGHRISHRVFWFVVSSQKRDSSRRCFCS